MKKHKSAKSLVVLIGGPLLLIALVVWYATRPAEVPHVGDRGEQPPVAEFSEPTTSSLAAAEFSSELPPVARRKRSDGFTDTFQEYSYTSQDFFQEYSFWPGGDEFLLEDVTFAPTYSVSEFTYSASFGIHGATSQKRNRFFVLGEDANGEQVIEKWVHKLKLKLNGAPFYRMVRTSVYRGFTLGVIELIKADPHGRFLMLVHSDSQGRHASQLSLTQPGQVTRLVDGSQVDWLEPMTPSSIYARLHVTEGLLWFMPLQGFPHGDSMLVFSDPEDDGLFDNIAMITKDVVDAIYPYFFPNPGVWLEDFVEYP